MALKFRLITNQTQHITIFVDRFDLNQFSSKVSNYIGKVSKPQGFMMLAGKWIFSARTVAEIIMFLMFCKSVYTSPAMTLVEIVICSIIVHGM